MEFFSLIENRRSMRKFVETPIEDAKLQKILQAINRAPSAGNLQAYEVFLVRKLEQRQALVKAAWDQEFLAEAPLVLIFCTHSERNAERYRERGVELYCIQDATIACTFAMLAAKALGIDSVWVGAFNEDEVRAILHLPGGLRPVAMLPLGYAGKEPAPRSRRELADLVHEA
jgi:nitroreductase